MEMIPLVAGQVDGCLQPVSPPRCEKCQCLERHRAYRGVFEGLRDDGFKEKIFLQFSQDRTVEPDWFASHEVSIYAGDNSLDLQKNR